MSAYCSFQGVLLGIQSNAFHFTVTDPYAVVEGIVIQGLQFENMH